MVLLSTPKETLPRRGDPVTPECIRSRARLVSREMMLEIAALLGIFRGANADKYVQEFWKLCVF
jgi:hypothetical protein